jgi:ribosome maturation factor RimP
LEICVGRCRDISKKAEQAVEAAVKQLITDNGYEYVGIEINKIPGAVELIIFIDSKDGIGLDDCEKVSRLIDPVIETKDPIEGPYYLCVSSPGLDRPLKNQSDFKRSIGKKVDIKLYRAVDKKKDFTGVLKAYDENGFTAEIGAQEQTFLYADTAIVRLHVDF